jgi:cytoskeletal protein RodZ
MSETPQEREEKARVRRRLLNLGEILAIGAVAISGLTLWNSYAERKANEAEHASESKQSAKKAVILTLRASADKDGRTLSLNPRADNQAIQSQTILFPSQLDLSAAETSGDGRIERNWFDSALVKARRAAGVEDKFQPTISSGLKK